MERAIYRFTRRDLLAGTAASWFPFFWWRSRKTMAGVRFRVMGKGGGGRRYLLIHGDESTAREVLGEHMRGRAGRAHLVTGTTRHVPLLGGEIDPNRLFSAIGAERSLRRLNPEWKEERVGEALRFLDRERPKLLAAILPPPGGLLVALHNNARGYSVEDEVPISNRVSLKAPGSPHEFLLATDPADFDRLSQGPFNVVDQSRAKGEDDGSLSRLAAARGTRYVNIEAGLGRKKEQAAMLAFLEKVLP